MAAYHAELLETAVRLVAREPGQSGRLPGARIRRSISTCYYALFHFLVEDACRRLVGHQHLKRRRIVARVFMHAGVKSTLSKIRGRTVDASLASFLRSAGTASNEVSPPGFAKIMAFVFIDAQSKRQSADYDLNAAFSELDARRLLEDSRDAMKTWQKAISVDERDFKDALALVMLLKGRMRADD